MKALTRFDPFAELNALQRQFFDEDWSMPLKSIGLPTTDIYTNGDKEMVIEAHLPNFNDENINISVDNGALIIQAEKHEREEDKQKKYVVRESSSSFYRRVLLPDRADADNINAHLMDGVLKITVPLTPVPEPKKISVKSKTKK